MSYVLIDRVLMISCKLVRSSGMTVIDSIFSRSSFTDFTIFVLHSPHIVVLSLLTYERLLLIFAELLVFDLVFICICMSTVRCKRSEYVKNVYVATC